VGVVAARGAAVGAGAGVDAAPPHPAAARTKAQASLLMGASVQRGDRGRPAIAISLRGPEAASAVGTRVVE